MTQLDLVVAADPRLRGAEGRSLGMLLGTAARAGYRTALLPVLGPAALPASAFHHSIGELLEQRRVDMLDPALPVDVRLALGWHWLPFDGAAARPARLVAERALLRIDQPLPEGDETGPPLDQRRLLQTAAAILGCMPALVAGDPAIARQLGPLSTMPWWAVVAGPSGQSFPRSGIVGRHAAGGAGAFHVPAPMGTLASTKRVVLAEAAAQRLLQEPDLPLGATLQPAELGEPEAYLGALDAWVMLASAAWRPWLPAALLEALAMAAPAILPPSLRAVLGEAALYADATTTGLEEWIADEGLVRSTRAAALELWRRQASPEALAMRLHQEIGPPAARPKALPIRPRRGSQRRLRVLMLSPNGIGMGHITRLLAIARRLPPAIEPVFLTMSQGLGVVRELGFIAEYTPYLGASRESANAWRQHFRARLQESISFYDPSLVLFDGNVPYQPLVDCIQSYRDRPFVWLRRAFWRPEAGRDTIDRVRHFELVVEPGELAAELDRGITVARRDEVVQVPPIILLDRDELMPAMEAKAALGLDPAKTAVLVQLGGRNNFDYRDIDRALALALGGDPGVEIVVVDWLIGESKAERHDGFRRVQAYPTSRWLNGFDFAVSAAGYNSFHELCDAGLPTIWVPNENPMMDEQELRAAWAERQGIAYLARTGDPHRLAWATGQLRDPAIRAGMRERARRLAPCDGAGRAAQLIAELARAHPADRSGQLLPATLAR